VGYQDRSPPSHRHVQSLVPVTQDRLARPAGSRARADEPFLEKFLPPKIGLDACGGAHRWARELDALGHAVRLIPPQYVKPYILARLDTWLPTVRRMRPEQPRLAGCFGAMGETPGGGRGRSLSTVAKVLRRPEPFWMRGCPDHPRGYKPAGMGPCTT
jgi:hypothetical protein